MIKLASPWALLLLPLLGVLLWRSLEGRRQPASSIGYSDLDLVRWSVDARSAWLSRLPASLAALGLALAIGALARPQAGMVVRNSLSRGIDIMLVIDTSLSMKASDLVPDRLAAAREVSQAFVQGRPDDRIGVVVFAGVAYTRCPLTSDHEALQSLLRSVETGITGTDGTALGTAIATAANRLKDTRGESRVIVLVTDGRSNAGEIDPVTAARLAAELGIRVYAIGVGTDTPGPLIIPDEFGIPHVVNAQLDLDDQTLQQVADLTGGRYFRATDNTSLGQIYAEIDRMERSDAPAQVSVEYRELYPWLLAPALALLGLALTLERTVLAEVP